jgi:SAM-dependent methyltransferase/uncharacterized coiled-coil protein SlyX
VSPVDEAKYFKGIDLADENSTHTKLINMVGENKKVVDFGCWTGGVAAILKERGCTVTGVEIDAEAAEEARKVCDKVIVGDLNDLDLAEALGGEKYDVGLFGDIIEHLTDPRNALAGMRESLAPGGYIVVSVPNVAHASVRLALLKGQFDYEDTGILDATHLRFYTRESIADLLESCGYLVDVMDWVDVKVSDEDLRDALDPLGLANMEEVVKAFSEWEAVAFQYVVKAVPATEEALVERLSEEKVKAEQQLKVLEREVIGLRELKENQRQVEEDIKNARAEVTLATDELAKSGEYARGLETRIQEKDVYIQQLENAVAESRQLLEGCQNQIAEMGATMEELEERTSGKKKKR